MFKNSRSQRLAKLLGITIFCVTFSIVVAIFRVTRANKNEGWKTTKEQNQPFHNSIITNGHGPAKLTATIITPTNNISVGSSQHSEGLSVKSRIFFDDKYQFNNDIPPSSVIAQIRNGNSVISSLELNPCERGVSEYIYEGLIEYPNKRGKYKLFVEVSFIAYDADTKSTASREAKISLPVQTYKYNVEGVTIDVLN